ncbi:putative kinetochore protein NUF2 [Thelohanellus kitauei]|uniref:Putative kinetochore protein NUF2 n=1 Tax=Thelohanellus kitauei TaxID=669202 RepID=A0A0C2IU70_THEKT|nr:putative kinetochore protein NUF2 [Thelohanellus kitauei]
MEGTEGEFQFLETLLPIIQKVDLNVSEEDFKIIDTNFLMGVLLAVFQSVGMNLDKILSAQSGCIKIFENNCAPFSNSVKYINILAITIKIFQTMGYNDISFDDFIRPIRPRISQILTILTNFIREKEEYDHFVCLKIKELHEKVNSMKQELNELESILPVKIEETHKSTESSRITNKMSELKSIVENQSKDFDELKALTSSLTLKLKNLDDENRELQSEIAILAINIVVSPAKIIKEAEDLTDKLGSLNSDYAQRQARLEKTRVMYNNNLKTFERIQGCLSFPEGLLIELDKIKKMISEIKKLTQINQDFSTSIQSIRNEINYYNEQLEIKQMATQKLETNLERKRDEAKKKLEQIQLTKEACIVEIKQLKTSLDQISDKKIKLENELENCCIDADDHIDRYNFLCQVSSSLHAYENLLDVVD